MTSTDNTDRFIVGGQWDTKKAMGKVRSLLDVAEHPDTDPKVAASFRAKAEALMRTYRVAEEELIAKNEFSLEPVLVSLNVADIQSPYRQQYINLMWDCAEHTGVRVTYEWERDGSGRYTVVAKMVGYESDTTYAEMLFTAARLVFSDRLEPQLLAGASDQENVYRLRAAGIERVRIAEMVWGEASKANLSRVGAMYKRECAKRGETPALSGRGVTGKVYRENYATEFTYELGSRLRRARNAADSEGGALTLHGRKERVNEAFYTLFPALRPSTEVAVPMEDPSKNCEKCKATKHESKKCKDHRPYEPTKADAAREAARMARYFSPAAMRGREAGVTAAQQVEIDRANKAKRLDEDSDRTATRNLTGLELEG